MIKVKASVKLKKGQQLPTDIELDIPKDCCNRDKFNKYIENILIPMCLDRLKIVHEVVE